MAPNFQSSFIPKEPITEQVFKTKKAGMLGVLIVSIFIASIVISVALYVYKGIIKGDIQSLQSELAQAEKNIDKKTINEMSQFSKKLSLVKSVVLKHKVLSNFLGTLSSSTVASVRFSDFNYSSEEGKLAVTLRGKAGSYANIAQQEKIFSGDKYFKSVTFSNLALVEGGLVSFDLAILVDPQISIYTP